MGSGVEFTGVCRQFLSSMMLGRVCGARAPAMLVHTVSLGAGVLRALLERAKLLFSIVDMMSVNGAAFRQVRVACETLTGVLLQMYQNAHGAHFTFRFKQILLSTPHLNQPYQNRAKSQDSSATTPAFGPLKACRRFGPSVGPRIRWPRIPLPPPLPP
eukprot:scaffold21234_cov95-Isochrysis_galbana.AAC.1